MHGDTQNRFSLTSAALSKGRLLESNLSIFVGFICCVAAMPCSAASVTTVVGLGDTEWGAASVPIGLSNVVAVSAGGYHSIVLKSDGAVTAWGNNHYGQAAVPAGLSNAVAVGAGWLHNLLLMSNGTVTAWGDDYFGQARVPPGLSNVVAIAAGGSQNLVLKQDGTVLPWGNPNFGLLNVPTGLSNVVAIAAGGDPNRGHDLALKSDGTVVAWGNNDGYAGQYAGQAAVPAGLDNVVAIAAGGYHSLALKRDGTVIAWGDAGFGAVSVPSGLTNVVAIAAGMHCSLALRSDGTVVGWGNFSVNYALVPVNIPPGLTNLIAIAGGGGHALLLQNDGSPQILWQPANQATYFGVPVSFGLGAVGRALNYQWQLNGADIEAATSASLTLTNPQAADAGSYRVLVSNALGSVTSSSASLAINSSSPILLIQPLDQSVLTGARVTLSAKAAGTAALDYQWRRYGTNLLGATDAVLILANAQSTDTGFYGVVVSNVLGYATSRQASLLVYAPPVILQQPTNRSVLVGTPTTFEVSAQSLPPVSWQWQFNGKSVSGATSPTFTISAVKFEDAGPYRAIVSNPLSTQPSDTAILTVIDGPPLILTGPSNQEVCLGGIASFGVMAGGSTPLHYQWLLNGTEISGATNSTLALTQVSTSSVGNYSVVITNAFGRTTSTEAALVIEPVIAWGNNDSGQITLPQGLATTVAIAAGYNHNLALKRDSSVMAWGANTDGQCQVPSGLTKVAAVAAGNSFSLALKLDGTVAGWGSVAVPSGLSNITAISAGENYALALRRDTTVTDWGLYGFPPSSIPSGLSNVTAISAGYYHSLALKVDGTVVQWRNATSWNTNFSCGIPVPPGLSNIVGIAAGLDYSLALKSNGRVAAWGCAMHAVTMVPEGLSNVVAIAAGHYHALALKSDGSIVGWGDNANGQVSVPAALSRAISIGAGSLHSLALAQVWQADQVTTRMRPLSAVSGGFQASFTGIPGLTYTLQRSEVISGPWSEFAYITVGSDGLGTWADTNAPPVSAYYRAVFP